MTKVDEVGGQERAMPLIKFLRQLSFILGARIHPPDIIVTIVDKELTEQSS